MKPTTKICSLAKAVKALTAVALITLCSLAASAQSTVLTKAEYEKITYSWTDDNGVTHDNVPITEKASNPRQIIELLSTVYKDSRVPGPYYNAYDKDGKRERETDYKNLTTNGWNVTGVQKPASEGYTVLIVAVKNTWSGDGKTSKLSNYKALVDYIGKSIDFVELIPDGMRIGTGENAGTLYNFSERLNRFFFISKGRTRKNIKNKDLAAFMHMYEQFSPTSTSGSTETSDFYEKMSSGEVYPVMHDCEGVLDLDHYFSMAGKKGTTSYDMTGVNFFIPDYRMKYWKEGIFFSTDGRTDDGDDYIIYNESHQPKTQMYTIKLTASAAEADTRKYTVTLNWTSNLNSLAGNVEQEYFVYRVIDGKVESTPLNSEPIYTTTWSEDVDQLQSGYALTYVVKGRPKGATFNPVQSNEASVSIPGFDPMERLKLNIKGDFESQYNQDSEHNNYSCTLQMNNGVGTSVKKQYLEKDTEFTFLRTTGSESTIVATLKITSVNTRKNQYSYSLTYANQGKDGSAVSKGGSSGTFTAKSDDDIDFNNFSITDDFCASTATNSHPDKYTYQVRFKPAVTVEGGSGEFVYSNSEDVFVLKTTNTVKDSYSKAQITADVNRSLSLSESITATFATAATPSIFRYVVRRTQLGSTTEIGQAQQTTEGQYAMSELAKNDKGNYTMTSTGETKSAGSLATVSDNSIIAPSQASYVPVIESYKADKTKAKNTFGCDIKSIHSIDVGIDNAIAMKSASTFQGEGDPSVKYRGFAASFTVMPLRTDDLTSYKFRIWRKINDGSEVLLGGTAPKGSDKWDIPTDYDLLNAEEGAAELQSSELTFADNFTAPEGTQKVTYIVRFYAEDADASNYYVSEETIDFDYTKVIPTQVDGVKAAKEVASVKYISTQGRQSSQAFSGVNIVVTTYTDGTTSTEKKLF